MRKLKPTTIGAIVAGVVAAGGLVAWAAGAFRAKAPKGKGIFVRSLVADTPTPADMVRRVKQLDLDWVALIGEDTSGQVSTYYPDRLPAYVDALKRAGVKV